MAFKQFMMDQLSNPPQELHIEILEILNATTYAITSLEIYKLSKLAITSRDISLEMQKTLKPKGLVEIDHKDRREGTAQEVAYWKITQSGKNYLASSVKVLPADLELENKDLISHQPSTTDEAVTEIEKIIDAPTKPTVASDIPDYSDKPKSYQMLKYIEAHPGCTNREIMLALGMDPYTYCSAFIKPYLDFIRIDKANEGHKVFTVTIPVDSFYLNRLKAVPAKKPGAAKNEATPIHEQLQETTATGALDAQAPAAEPQQVVMPEVQTATGETHQPEVGNDHPAAKVRFAITSDKRIILMGLTAEDIELTEHDSTTLIKFCGDISLAANVSDALATRMIDLETLGS